MNEYVITFGSGQMGEGHYILIEAESEAAAREWMFENYGKQWCTSYPLEEWQKWQRNAAIMGLPQEKLLMHVKLESNLLQKTKDGEEDVSSR